jgi:hypothetical protein
MQPIIYKAITADPNNAVNNSAVNNVVNLFIFLLFMVLVGL